jgi:hypothetical protein
VILLFSRMQSSTQETFLGFLVLLSTHGLLWMFDLDSMLHILRASKKTHTILMEYVFQTWVSEWLDGYLFRMYQEAEDYPKIMAVPHIIPWRVPWFHFAKDFYGDTIVDDCPLDRSYAGYYVSRHHIRKVDVPLSNTTAMDFMRREFKNVDFVVASRSKKLMCYPLLINIVYGGEVDPNMKTLKITSIHTVETYAVSLTIDISYLEKLLVYYVPLQWKLCGSGTNLRNVHLPSICSFPWETCPNLRNMTLDECPNTLPSLPPNLESLTITCRKNQFIEYEFPAGLTNLDLRGPGCLDNLYVGNLRKLRRLSVCVQFSIRDYTISDTIETICLYDSSIFKFCTSNVMPNLKEIEIMGPVIDFSFDKLPIYLQTLRVNYCEMLNFKTCNATSFHLTIYASNTFFVNRMDLTGWPNLTTLHVYVHMGAHSLLYSMFPPTCLKTLVVRYYGNKAPDLPKRLSKNVNVITFRM